MSYDLEIKADDEYSQSVDCDWLMSFVARLPSIMPNGSRGFVLDDRPRRWMEIDFESVSPDGDFDLDLSREPKVNCIRFHIPYGFLENLPNRDYFPTAWAIAEFLGWRLFNPQRDNDLLAGDLAPEDVKAMSQLVRQARRVGEA